MRTQQQYISNSVAGDDNGALSRALGLVLDAPGLGGQRLQRSAIVVEDGKVVGAYVEPVSGKGELHANMGADGSYCLRRGRGPQDSLKPSSW